MGKSIDKSEIREFKLNKLQEYWDKKEENKCCVRQANGVARVLTKCRGRGYHLIE